jgi:ankyrin repeat protein
MNKKILYLFIIVISLCFPARTMRVKLHKTVSTALHEVCFKNDIQKFMQLIEDPDVNVDAKDGNGNTPLHLAAVKGYLWIVRELAEIADTNLTNDKGYTPLHGASHNKHELCVEELLKNGASVGEISSKYPNYDLDTYYHKQIHGDSESSDRIYRLLMKYQERTKPIRFKSEIIIHEKKKRY